MRDQSLSPANTGADGPYETLLAGLSAERDRYELLLDINNAVVTQLGLGNLLCATCDSLRKVIPHDTASICLYDPEIRQLRLHSFESAIRERR